MSDYDLPDLPSDDELGITEEDIKALEEEQVPPPPAGDGGGDGAEPPRDRGKKPPAPGGGGDGPTPGAAPAETPPPPAGGLRGPLTLLALLLVTLVSTQWWALPSPVPANAPDTTFSSARAMSHLVEIAAQAHPPGSPEHDRVRAYIVDELSDLGLDPTVQTTTSMIRGGDVLRAATVRNVIARIPGTDPSGTLLLTAHYDGRGISRAAADDGMGVVTILETARALLAGAPPRNDVLLLLTDAEELGLLGARAFVAESPLADQVDVALSIEMRGGAGASIMFETGAANGWIVRQYAEHAPAPVANSVGYEVYRRMPNDTDFTPLKESGIQGLNFAGIGRAHLYHQAYDAPENVSEATLQHHGLQVLPMTRALAAADLGTVEAPDVVYFSLPFVGMVVYGEQVGWAVAAGLLLLFVLVVVLVRRRGGGWGGVGVGALLSLAVAGAGWFGGAWLVGWLSGFHPERDSLHAGVFHVEGWYVLAMAAGVFFLATLLQTLLRRRFGLGALALGAATVPTVGALAATFLVPMAAMDLQWPAAAALMAAAAVSGVGPRGRPGWPAWGLALLMTLPVLFLLASLLEFTWLALGFGAAPVLGVLLAVIFALLVPALDALREPNAWWAPTVGLVAAGAFLGIGLLHARPSAERPLHTTLAYVADRATGDASWLTHPTGEDAEGDTDPTRAWAVERIDAPFTESWSGAFFLRDEPTLPSAPAPPVEAAQPQLAVAADTVLDGVRRVRLALRSGIGAEMVLVEIPDGVVLEAVNGKALPGNDSEGGAVDPVRRMTHWGRPAEALTLELEVPAEAATLSLGVVEHLLRPEELLGPSPWRRPPDMAPDITRYSDRAMIRTPLRVALVPGATGTLAPGQGGGATPPGSEAPAADSVPAPADTVPLAAPASTDTVPGGDTTAPDTVGG